MFTFGKGIPIAKIIGGKLNGEIIYLDTEQDKDICCKKCSKFCLLKNCCKKCKFINDNDEDDIGPSLIINDGKLLPLPNPEARQIHYISGPSGSGKSTYASNMMKIYKKLLPKLDLIVFSRKASDPVIDKLKPYRYIIDESLITEPIDIMDELKGGAILLFDDVNTIQDDKIKKAMDKLMNDAMEVGRSENINMLITNHLVIPNEKKMARTIMNELHNLTIFPKSGSAQQIRYALKTYFGMNNKQIDEILKLPSRWVTISKSYPTYVLHEHGVYIPE